jgi:hypothetical protein
VATCSKEVEIEFGDDGEGCCKTIDVTITVNGVYDPHAGADADGNRGHAEWFIDETSCHFDPEGLTAKEIEEIKEKVEKIIEESDWDFDSACEDEEADDYIPPEEY